MRLVEAIGKGSLKESFQDLGVAYSECEEWLLEWRATVRWYRWNILISGERRQSSVSRFQLSGVYSHEIKGDGSCELVASRKCLW